MKNNLYFLISITFLSSLHGMQKYNPITMAEKFYQSITDNKPDEALKWFYRWKALAGLDYKWLTTDQKLQYGVHFDKMYDKASRIKPTLLNFEDLKDEKIEWQWLKTMLETDQCDGLEWREQWTPTTDNSTPPSPTTLKKIRLKKLSTFGTIQTMEK